jgi:hypothetical protein
MNRRRLSLSDKVSILLRYARCPAATTRWPRGRWSGTTSRRWRAAGPTPTRNMQPLCEPCHQEKTTGRPATTRGSDIHEIAKTKRLTQKEKEFRASLLRRDVAFLPGDHIDAALNAARPTRKIPSRPFPKRKSE